MTNNWSIGAAADRALLASLVESSGDAIASVARDGTILSWKPAARDMFEVAAPDAVGRSIDEVSWSLVHQIQRVRREAGI